MKNNARASKVTVSADGRGRPRRYFEVADVRLTHAPDGGDEKWVAYGTLRSTSGRPGSGGYWNPGSLD